MLHTGLYVVNVALFYDLCFMQCFMPYAVFYAASIAL